MGIRNGHRTTKNTVVAYGNDVSTFVTAPEDSQVIRDLLRNYERAMGACLNFRKFKAMATDSWDTSINILDIPYYPE
jgi:hypothetical protein